MSTMEGPAARHGEGAAGATQTTRVDKWLFHARFYRTRASASAAAAGGKIRLNGARVDKPGHALRCGDVLTLKRGAALVSVRVLALAERRGPADTARALYEAAED